MSAPHPALAAELETLHGCLKRIRSLIGAGDPATSHLWQELQRRFGATEPQQSASPPIRAVPAEALALLLRYKARYQAVFEQGAVGIAITSVREDRYLEANPAFLAMLGYELPELRLCTVQQLTHPEDWCNDRDLWQRLLRGEIAGYSFEKRCIRRDGSPIDLLLHVSLVKDPQGDYIISQNIDISARKRAETELRLSEARMQALIDNLPFGIWAKDSAGQTTISNRMDRLYWDDLSGGSLQVAESSPEDPHQIWRDINRSALASGQVVRTEYSYIQQGQKRTFLNIVAPFAEGSGQLGLIGVDIDITAQKQMESELRQSLAAHERSEARLRAVLEAIPDGMVLHNRRGDYLEVKFPLNYQSVIPAQDWRGRNIRQIMPAAIATRFLQLMDQALVSGHLQVEEYRILVEEEERVREVRFAPCGPEEILCLVRDITERKRAEAMLRRTQERLHHLLASSPAAIYSSAVDEWRIQFISDNIESIVGHPAARFLADPGFWASQIHPEDAAQVLSLDKGRLAEQSHMVCEYRFCCADGDYRWLRDEWNYLRDADGNWSECIGYLIDITDRKQAEEALRQSEARHRALLWAIPDGIVRTNCQGDYLDYKPPTAFNSPVPANGWQGRNIRHFLPSAETEPLLQCLQRTIAGQEINAHEFQLLQAGQLRHREARMVPYGSDEVLVLVRDITEPKQALEALQLSEANNRALLAAIPDGLVRFSREGHYLDFQIPPHFRSPIDPERSRGRHVSEIWPPSVALGLQAAIARALDSQSTQVYEYELRLQGTQHHREARLVPCGSDQVLGLIRDITSRKELDQQKDEFMAIISHELRTPLTSMRALLGLLATGRLGTLSEQGQRLLQISLDDSERLERLVDSILDLERLKAGKVEMPCQHHSIADLQEKVVGLLLPLAQQKRVKILTNAAAGQIWGNSDRIVQVLTNLVGNAIKFSPADGSIWLTTSHHPDHILWQVRDQGSGIPSDKLELIFEWFQQVGQPESRPEPGAGLGLAICRQIIQQHGGRIWAESSPAGSTFCFSLPHKRPDPASIPCCEDEHEPQTCAAHRG